MALSPSGCSAVPLQRSPSAPSPSASPRRDLDLSLRVPSSKNRRCFWLGSGGRWGSLCGVTLAAPCPLSPNPLKTLNPKPETLSSHCGHAAPVSTLKGNIPPLLSWTYRIFCLMDPRSAEAATSHVPRRRMATIYSHQPFVGQATLLAASSAVRPSSTHQHF